MKKNKHLTYPQLFVALAIWLIMGTAIAQSNYFPQLSAILSTDGWPVAVKIGDVTGDGIKDVVMINNGLTTTANNNHIVVFSIGPMGALRAPITFEYSDEVSRDRSLALLNVDDDDALEIVAGVDRTLVIADYNASGLFDVQTVNTFRRNDRLAAIDVNLDGQQDLVAVQTEDQLMAVIYLTNGSGSLQVYGGMDLSDQGEDFALAVADVTGDGLDDLLVMDGQGTGSNTKLWVFEHDGLNDFAQPVGYAVGSVFDLVNIDQINTGDFNQDGLTDVLLTRKGGAPNFLLTQNQNGWLNPYTELSLPNRLASAATADVDGNGEDDIVSIHNGTLFEPTTLNLTFQANGALSNPETVPLPQNIAFRPEAMALADINGDDCTDIIIADRLEGFVYYRGTNCQQYADLELTGRARGHTTFIVTLENLQSSTPVEEGEASVHIFVESPLHQLLGQDVILFDEKFLPEECTLTRLDLSAYEIECEASRLASGDTTKWGFRYNLLHNVYEGSIRVTGILETNRPDPNPDNNSFQLFMGGR